jgi:hypothetical protein
MDNYNQVKWSAFGPSGTNSIEGIFEFAKQWNDFLDGTAAGARFKGIVLDYEEFYNNRNPTVLQQVQDISALKESYAMLSGIALGYQPFSDMKKWDSIMDHFYLEFYDYYYSPFANASPTESPFIKYLNDPIGLAEFTVNTVLEGLSEDTSKYGDKVCVMWSLQTLSDTCLYPLTDGTCGINYEFGAGWSARMFNEYLSEFRKASPNLGSKPQGVFQFSFMPQSWMVHN